MDTIETRGSERICACGLDSDLTAETGACPLPSKGPLPCDPNAEPLLAAFRDQPTCRALARLSKLGISYPRALALAKALPIVWPWDDTYDKLRQNANRRFNVFPLMIVMCQTVTDVLNALELAKELGLHFSLRGGGHSYGGYSLSSDMIIDQSKRIGIQVDPAQQTITIEAGVLMGPMALEMAKYGMCVPAGTCANVGVVGLTLGGGIGFLTREHGLTLDHLLEAEVILVSGEIVTTNNEDYPDLFWALRGGGGGNFGIVTSMTFHMVPIDHVVLYELVYPSIQAETLITAWQTWLVTAPTIVSTEVVILKDKIVLEGQIIGRRGEPVVEEILSTVTSFVHDSKATTQTTPEKVRATTKNATDIPTDKLRIWETTYLNAVRYFTGRKVLASLMAKNHADFYDHNLPSDGIRTVVTTINSGPEGCRFSMTALGGAAQEVDPTATAFYHRDALFWVQYGVVFNSSSEQRDKMAWLNDFYQVMSPYASGASYINCVDEEIKDDWDMMYYGANYARLREIKEKYDPDRLLTFKQGI